MWICYTLKIWTLGKVKFIRFQLPFLVCGKNNEESACVPWGSILRNTFCFLPENPYKKRWLWCLLWVFRTCGFSALYEQKPIHHVPCLRSIHEDSLTILYHCLIRRTMWICLSMCFVSVSNYLYMYRLLSIMNLCSIYFSVYHLSMWKGD